MTQGQIDTSEGLKSLSAQDFLNFGLQQVAYIRPIKVDSRDAYVLHAADGTALSVMDTLGTAQELARHNDLEPVTIQ